LEKENYFRDSESRKIAVFPIADQAIPAKA
jgi:hypothetical protein